MPVGNDVDRRSFLRGAASAVALSGTATLLGRTAAAAASGDFFPYLMAMHIHACFSEGDASMAAHLQQAKQNGIDVIWWTEHDHRMVARNYLKNVHFNSLTESTDGLTLVWRSQYEGQVSSSAATIVSNPVMSTDPGGKALRLAAGSNASGGGTRRLVADPSNFGLNTSLTDTIVRIGVQPEVVGSNGWIDIRLITSHRPATGGRLAGQYTIIYRIGGSQTAGTRTLLDERTALVVLAAPTAHWTTLALDPVTDMNGFWPNSDFRDSALTEFSLAATARSGASCQAVVDGLMFDRQARTGSGVLQTQRSLIDFYATKYPTVRQHRGMEASENTPHLNWFGHPFIWPPNSPANQDLKTAIEYIHGAGGLASYNHPYGTSGGPFNDSQRDAKRRALTATLISEQLFDADILEVGYLTGRAGMHLSDYLALWDALSRNAIFVTGIGTSDDHNGRDWMGLGWRAVTGVWSASTELGPLLRALRAGRAWFTDPVHYKGGIQLLANGFIAMGQAGVITKSQVDLVITTNPIPANWSVQVIRGTVDEAGSGSPDPLVTRQNYQNADTALGAVTVPISTTSSCFVRVEVRDENSATRIYSNPVWLLRALPSNGIPKARLAIRP